MHFLFLVVLISWANLNIVHSLSCYDCGPLYLPSSQCTQRKECPNGFCTYFNRTVENRSQINFQCSPTAQLNAPGGSVFSTLNNCKEMREGNVYYRLKICNDFDLCNAECNFGRHSYGNMGLFQLLILILLFTQIRTIVLSS